jgi:2-amino-4-hydroxy-6-hydroxymethyldihydropteridine diphosphokinase
MDVLMYGDVEQDDPKLILPHPRLSERRFVLEPLLEIEPAATLPAGTPLKKLLDELGDDQATWRVGEL